MRKYEKMVSAIFAVILRFLMVAAQRLPFNLWDFTLAGGSGLLYQWPG